MSTVQEAIDQLSTYEEGVFPREALQTIISHREEATPLLVNYLQTVANNVETAIEEDNTDALIFVVHLLAQFRATSAYKPLIQLLNQIDDENDWILGDGITESMSRIIASVCDGGITPIQQLAENPAVDEFTRSAAFYSLVTLTCQNRMEPETLKEYVRSMLAGGLKYEGGYLRISLVLICEMMMFSDLLDDIRSCYKECPDMANFSKLEDIENNLLPENHDEFSLSFHRDYITDTIAELEKWASFQPEDEMARIDEHFPISQPSHLSDRSQYEPMVTFVREAPKTGRNDPCPCGSGKKFKKCCMN